MPRGMWGEMGPKYKKKTGKRGRRRAGVLKSPLAFNFTQNHTGGYVQCPTYSKACTLHCFQPVRQMETEISSTWVYPSSLMLLFSQCWISLSWRKYSISFSPRPSSVCLFFLLFSFSKTVDSKLGVHRDSKFENVICHMLLLDVQCSNSGAKYLQENCAAAAAKTTFTEQVSAAKTVWNNTIVILFNADVAKLDLHPRLTY